MLKNAGVTAFTVSELLRENQQGGGGKIADPPRLSIKVKEALLKSNIRYVELFFSIHWRFELARVYCSVGYNYHTISLTVVTKFVFQETILGFS